MKEKNKKEKGITLIALVITIIVLLILAGITINLTIGQDGIIRRAQEAGKNYLNAADYEQEQLAEFTNETDKIIGNKEEPKYTMVDGVPVPKGFTHTEGTLETGFVIKNDVDGNEFVWVPVNETTSYGYERIAFLSGQPANGIDEAINSIKIKYSLSGSYYFTETMRNIDEDRTELDSVNEYKGFYIGRYEVGIIGYDASVSTSNTNNETSWTGYTGGTAVVQQGQQVYNYITRDKAKEVAESMYTNNDAVISRLCSSYAWDTALKFIETNYQEYPTNSAQGNYKDTTFEYTNLNGQMQTKEKDASTLVLTGQTTAVNNIYDMGGNVWEWIMEGCNEESYRWPYTQRGGSYASIANDYPAAYRTYGNRTGACDGTGFRSTLYL